MRWNSTKLRRPRQLKQKCRRRLIQEKYNNFFVPKVDLKFIICIIWSFKAAFSLNSYHALKSLFIYIFYFLFTFFIYVFYKNLFNESLLRFCYQLLFWIVNVSFSIKVSVFQNQKMFSNFEAKLDFHFVLFTVRHRLTASS